MIAVSSGLIGGGGRVDGGVVTVDCGLVDGGEIVDGDVILIGTGLPPYGVKTTRNLRGCAVEPAFAGL